MSNTINFKDIKQGDTIEVTVHGITNTWVVMGWYNVNDNDCIGLLRDENVGLMLQEKFAEDIKLIQKTTRK